MPSNAAFVQSVSASGSSPLTSSSITTTSGNALVVFGGGSITSISDSKGNTYSSFVTGVGTVYYCTNITGGSSHTVTVTTSGSQSGFTVQEWSGFLNSSPIDTIGTVSTPGSGTTYTSSSVTANYNNEVGILFVQANYQNTGRFPTIGTGGTTSNLSQVTISGAANYIVLGMMSTATLTYGPITADGSVSPTMTSSPFSDHANNVLVLFRSQNSLVGPIIFTETISSSDSKNISLSTLKTDGISLAEVFSAMRLFLKSVSDSITISDTFSRLFVAILNLSDTFTGSDLSTRFIKKIFPESISSSESIAKRTSRNILDSGFISDILTAARGTWLARTFTYLFKKDSPTYIRTKDQVGQLPAFPPVTIVPIPNPIPSADIRNLQDQIAVFDSFTLLRVPTVKTILGIDLSSISDRIAKQIGRSISESVFISEQFSAIKSPAPHFLPIAEGIRFTESFSLTVIPGGSGYPSVYGSTYPSA